MGEPTEGVSFSDGPYLMYQNTGITDGTANPQVIGSDFADALQVISPPTSGPYFIEPGFNFTLGQRPMDDFARVLFVAITNIIPATATITGTLSFRRGVSGEVFTPPELTDILLPIASANTGFSIVSRLPQEFMRDPTGATIGDSLRPRFTVTPENTTVHTVGYFLMCVPVIGQGSATNPPGGRGQVVSTSIQGNR